MIRDFPGELELQQEYTAARALAIRQPPTVDEVVRHPEDDVIDEIDRLVTDSMKRGMMRDRYDTGMPVCSVCNAPWHGLRGNGVEGCCGCPGEYGTDAQKQQYLDDRYLDRRRPLKVAEGDKI